MAATKHVSTCTCACCGRSDRCSEGLVALVVSAEKRWRKREMTRCFQMHQCICLCWLTSFGTYTTSMGTCFSRKCPGWPKLVSHRGVAVDIGGHKTWCLYCGSASSRSRAWSPLILVVLLCSSVAIAGPNPARPGHPASYSQLLSTIMAFRRWSRFLVEPPLLHLLPWLRWIGGRSAWDRQWLLAHCQVCCQHVFVVLECAILSALCL